MDEVERLKKAVMQSENIVFFGGAGVSTESGIPDFRSEDGLYHEKYRFPPEEILSHSFFMAYPEIFFRFYREKMLYPNAEPNFAHMSLAKLEEMGKLRRVITQNIDGLHQMAGSHTVTELHGSVHQNHCMKCGRFFSMEDILHTQGIPRCDCGGIIKPDVVLYEEPLDNEAIRQALEAIHQADLILIGGTSLNVYPAAGFIQGIEGERLAVINKDVTPADQNAGIVIHESIGTVLKRVVE